MVGGNWLILGGGGFVVMLGCGWWWGSDLVGGLWVLAMGFEFIYLFVYFICMSFFRLF